MPVCGCVGGCVGAWVRKKKKKTATTNKQTTNKQTTNNSNPTTTSTLSKTNTKERWKKERLHMLTHYESRCINKESKKTNQTWQSGKQWRLKLHKQLFSLQLFFLISCLLIGPNYFAVLWLVKLKFHNIHAPVCNPVAVHPVAVQISCTSTDTCTQSI